MTEQIYLVEDRADLCIWQGFQYNLQTDSERTWQI